MEGGRGARGGRAQAHEIGVLEGASCTGTAGTAGTSGDCRGTAGELWGVEQRGSGLHQLHELLGDERRRLPALHTIRTMGL